MLACIAPDLWHAARAFRAAGIPVTSRMTVVRLRSGGLWLHSPVLIDDALAAQLDALGPVQCIVAPNKVHHLFAKKALARYPQAQLYGAPGLAAKRPDLPGLIALAPQAPAAWRDEIDQVFMAGFPFANETVFFHRASGSVIITDICQWWQGPLDWRGALYAHVTGVRARLAVPRTLRLAIRDKAAFKACARQVLAWPVERVIVAHNSVVEQDAKAALTRAFACFD